MDLFTQLSASLLIRYNALEVLTSDMTDMKILSNLLPYCHVMTTDKFMQELVRVLKFEERFGVRVFSGQTADIAELLGGHLKTGQSWTAQNRPVGARSQARAFYRVRS
jgi:hypothetical protein